MSQQVFNIPASASASASAPVSAPASAPVSAPASASASAPVSETTAATMTAPPPPPASETITAAGGVNPILVQERNIREGNEYYYKTSDSAGNVVYTKSRLIAINERNYGHLNGTYYGYRFANGHIYTHNSRSDTPVEIYQLGGGGGNKPRRNKSRRNKPRRNKSRRNKPRRNKSRRNKSII